jgi:hypothetical protein
MQPSGIGLKISEARRPSAIALTIRNKSTEAMLRRLGQRWNVGPSGVIRRLAEEELARLEAPTPDEIAKRLAGWDELMAMVPEFTEADKQRMQRELDHMYDYLDGEAAPGDSKAAE